MSGIAPGAYVRAVSGMYRGAEGRVVRIDDGANGPYATVDVGGTMWPTIAVYVSALELVGAVPTTARGAARARRPLDGADAQALEGALTMTEQERDAAIAERDAARVRSREAAQTIIAEIGADGPEGVDESARRVVGALRVAHAERDQLRAQVTDLLPEADAKQHFATRALRAEERLQRLLRELEALRDDAHANAALLLTCERDEGAADVATAHADYRDRLDAILRGGES